MGNYQAVKEMGLSALEARDTILGVEHPVTLSTISSLGLLFLLQGKYQEAEAVH
jgi:hypothetical protein